MLTLEQLQQYYRATNRERLRGHEHSMVVEYLQHELLDSLFAHTEAGRLSFIGGTSIRLLYGGSRFSEDIDFDNFGLGYQAFEDLLHSVAQHMRYKGFVAEFRSVERGAYHCYVRFPHVLQELGLSPHDDEKILVRIDAMHKEYTVATQVHILNKFGVYRQIIANPIEVILAQKLIAVCERPRERGRDLYDISFLYGMTEPDMSFLERATGKSRHEFFTLMAKRIATFDVRALAREVTPFLIQSDEINRVLSFPDFIAQKISSALKAS